MATIVTYEQTVPALTAKINNPTNAGDNAALSAAMSAAGIGGSGGVALSPVNIMLTTAGNAPGGIPTGTFRQLATFTIPRTGIIHAAAQVGITPLTFTGALNGAMFMHIMLNGLKVAGTTVFSTIPGVFESPVCNPYLPVTAGQTLSLGIEFVNTLSGTGTWQITDTAYSSTVSPDYNNFSYFYIG